MVWRVFLLFFKIDKSKRENPKELTEEEKELFDITPSGDHLFCGKMSISKAEDNYCQVSLRFMSDKYNHNIKHYQGTLVLSKQYSAGFISLYGQSVPILLLKVQIRKN